MGAQLSKTRGGILQEASVKWMGGSWDRLDEKILARMSRCSREVKADEGTWFTFPKGVDMMRFLDAWKAYPRDPEMRVRLFRF